VVGTLSPLKKRPGEVVWSGRLVGLVVWFLRWRPGLMLKPDTRRGANVMPLRSVERDEMVLEQPLLVLLTAAQEEQAVELLAALFAAAARRRRAAPTRSRRAA
jgi:hypothetical protein